ncbi:LysR family transcriptional regulator (plasmid) [Arthrobacter sp. D3-18]
MQELLGRLHSLDPGAVASLRVIACFDELIVGGVNSQALLSAAASLAGCVAGFAVESPSRAMRFSPSGEQLAGARTGGSDARSSWSDHGLSVWLEREGDPHANDAIILERLSLALRIKQDKSAVTEPRRDLGLMVDSHVDEDRRLEAAARQGFSSSTRYRIIVAPLFATWQRHPRAREDVVGTPVGPVHTLVVPESTTFVEGSPVGIGQPALILDFPRSFRTAVVALRLSSPPDIPVVLADDYGGLLEVLADVPAGHQPTDVSAIAKIAEHSWGHSTLDAIVRTGSVREAARAVGIHHSTMTTRVQAITETLGFDPLGGMGRVRLGLAYLIWRLHESRSLTLPAPADGIARVY